MGMPQLEVGIYLHLEGNIEDIPADIQRTMCVKHRFDSIGNFQVFTHYKVPENNAWFFDGVQWIPYAWGAGPAE